MQARLALIFKARCSRVKSKTLLADKAVIQTQIAQHAFISASLERFGNFAAVNRGDFV